MTEKAPSFDDIFVVMSSASVGHLAARVTVPEHPKLDDPATTFALALNILLDDLAFSAGEARREVLEHARLAERLRILADASREFATATGDLQQLLETVARRISELVGDLCVIRTITADGEWVESGGAGYGGDPELLATMQEVARSSGVRFGKHSLRVISTGEPLLIPKTDAATFAAAIDPKYRAVIERVGVSSSMTVPLTSRGNVLGVATLIRSISGKPYDETDLRFVQSVADHAALAIGNALSYAGQRAAREAAEEAKEKARALEARYRLMFDMGPLPKWMYDAETLRFLDVNEVAVRDYGYSREEYLGMTLGDLWPPEDTPAVLEALRSVTQATIRQRRTRASRHRKKSGDVIEVEVTIDTFSFEGRPCCIAVGRDVTERHRLEEQLRQSQKMEAVGRLAGGVAHDFNNLLSVILGYGEMLLADMSPTDPMRADLLEIRTAANRAAALTKQLLMFSRQKVLEPRILDLNEVLTNMDSMLQRILGADVDLVSIPTKPLGRVRVDATSVEQVIMNLVVNARDAMPTGGKLTMETSNVILDEAYAAAHLGVTPGPHVMLAVTDTGTGIDKATMARMFEPFFTTKESGKGTGLGLSTVFGVVQQSKGSVWVYSEPGKGTSFKVYLPRVDEAADTLRDIEQPATLRGSETILLVEDDDQVRVVARGILRRAGYHVIEARNAGEALLHSESYAATIHLLLSDVVMPQMSGPALAKRLASARPEMKVLCMSGYTDDSIVRHGVLESNVAYLQKPLTPEALTTRVREVLDRPERGKG